jgi:hypothetical protein
MITEYKLLAHCNGLTVGKKNGQGDSQTDRWSDSRTGEIVRLTD